jgi:dienelactone hydrolase
MKSNFPRARTIGLLAVGAWLTLLVLSAARAEAPRVLPRGQLPDDRRLGPLLDLNGYFPFTPCATRQEWQSRAERLRRQLLVATGLWPMPTKTPAHAVIHGVVDRDGYTVAKVYLESYPGHFVTGNLYRPTRLRPAPGRSGRLPGVLCPHGHWPEGRFYDAGESVLRKQIATGAERFDPSGRYPLQARCVQLARMGCVVFHYDMVGYADSVQLQHRAGVRAAMNTAENWGYFSPQAEARLQTQMGLQTYNSVCALDWLSHLPDVDPARIGVTGASGGGTQTFILCAIDPRPAVAFPAVMVSTAMQGGCTCENCSYLRVGTGNVEIAALIAPRPLGMTAADDWTKALATKGFPELRQLYKLFGAESAVMATPLLQFPHNYNYASRAVMYGWMNKHLKLGLTEPIAEQDFRPLSIAEMSVWDAAHPKPPSGDDYERSLLRRITLDSDAQLGSIVRDIAPSRPSSRVAQKLDAEQPNTFIVDPGTYREIVGGAIDVLIGRRLPPAEAIEARQTRESTLGPWQTETMLLRNVPQHEEVPAVVLRPKSWNRHAVVWISRQGKQSLFDASGEPRPAIARLLAGGMAVLGVDLLGQGEFTADGRPWAKARLNKSGHGDWTQYAGFTFGYNYPLMAQRVHDILSAVAYVRGPRLGAEVVSLAGLGGAGHWVAAACAQAGAAVDRAAIDTGGFRFARLSAIDDPNFLPGGAKYLDLPGILALAAPGKMWLAGEGKAAPAIVARAYEAAGRAEHLSVFDGPAEQREAAAVAWILKE